MNFAAFLKELFVWLGGGTVVLGILGYGGKLVVASVRRLASA